MATQYVQQATSQIAPVYDQSIQALESQVPAIQQLYQVLSQGLQNQSNQQITSGVTQINEDASRRGVLRSTLPTDSRQALTASIGAALTQGLAEFGAKQAGEVAGVRTQIGDVNVRKAGAIADLARALETQDLERQRLEMQRAQAEREFQLKQQELAASRSRGSGGSQSQSAVTASLRTALNQDIMGFLSQPNAKDKFYTEKVVIPRLTAAYPELGAKAITDSVYQTRKAVWGN